MFNPIVNCVTDQLANRTELAEYPSRNPISTLKSLISAQGSWHLALGILLVREPWLATQHHTLEKVLAWKLSVSALPEVNFTHAQTETGSTGN